MKVQNRRDFIKMAALAGGAAAVGGCATSASTAPAIAGDMAFGVLLHLGVHMWGDWTADQSCIPNSPEEFAKMYPDYRGTCKTSCMGGAASSLPAICRRMGNEDVAPPWFCKRL